MAGQLPALSGYEFTFETYLNSKQIEADFGHVGDDIFDTQSLSESIATFEEEFGRTYHSYHAGSYHFPNDPTEAERLDEQHGVLKELMEGRLYFAPISPISSSGTPFKVLDIATGTGLWAIEFGDQFPEANIIGTDLSPIQPTLVPPNVRFFIEDSAEDWDYPANFDYIHTRVTLGCWQDMKTQIMERAFGHLRPGGWLECQEVLSDPSCDDGTLPDDHDWLRWARDASLASEIIGRQLRLGDNLKHWMREAGFVNITETVLKLPMGGWPKDPRLKHIGMRWLRNYMSGLSGFTLGLFHRVLGRTVEEIELSLVEIRKDLFSSKIHAYNKVFIVTGQKPEAARSM